jgi:peroxiredoxin Q/BCP
MDQLIREGSEIPAFTAKDYSGAAISKDDLLGSPFIIYFYPKDDTPGCTKEACSFRDSISRFNDLDVTVIGVSPDNAESHQKFIDKYQLNFSLISDENFDIARKFGVVTPKEGGGFSIVRSTFLCDENGIIQWVESPVEVDGHIERVISAISDVRA